MFPVFVPTMIIMPSEVFPTYEEVMIKIQFPELAVDDVEMLIAEILRDLVDIFFWF